ncbi:MAG: hypothetical protein ACI9KE_005781, partial [Polyangiales bacterium]
MFVRVNVPVFRHPIVEFDVARGLLGLLELRARFKRRFIVGAALYFRTLGASLGMEFSMRRV